MPTAKARRIRRYTLRGLSIQQRLPLLICVLLLCVVISFGLISYFAVRKSALQTGIERLHSVNSQWSNILSQSAQGLISATRMTAEQRPIKSFLQNRDSVSRDSALLVLQKLQPDSTYILVDLLDKDGHPILRSGKKGIETRIDFTSLIDHRDTGRIGKISLINDSMFYGITAAITDGKEITGYITRWRVLKSTQKGVDQFLQLMGAGTKAMYIGNNDRSLWTNMIKPVKDPLASASMHNDSTADYIDSEGLSVIAAVKPIHNTSWLLIIEFSKDAVLAPAASFLRSAIIIGSVIVLIGIFLAWLMSRNIILPLNRLSTVATSIAAGNYPGTVEVERRDETGKLARAFNAMIEELNNAKQGLEKKVVETSEINDQLRSLSAYLQNVREDERIHIAREMHDELGQLLTGFKMDVSSLKKKLTDNNDPAVEETLENMLTVVDEAVRFVRRLASELRPSILDDLGLVPALEWHAREFEKRFGIQTEFSAAPINFPISPLVATGLFRICQESLTNVARHSNAKKVAIKLYLQNDELCLSIEDDGKGFDTMKVNKKTLGLLGMKERAAMIQGSLEFMSTIGQGTTVIIKIRQPLMEKQVSK